MTRALKLVSLSKDDICKKNGEMSDVVRGGLVLGISAFDAYFTKKFVDNLVLYLQKYGPTNHMVKMLEEAKFDTKTALKMLRRDKTKRPYRKIRTLVEEHLEKRVTQSFKTIDELFVSMGLKNLSKNAEQKASRCNLRKRISIAVQRRHSVVHNGDLNDHGKPRKIDPDDTKKRLEEIKLFVGKSDEIIDSRLKNLRKTSG